MFPVMVLEERTIATEVAEIPPVVPCHLTIAATSARRPMEVYRTLRTSLDLEEPRAPVELPRNPD